MGCQAYDCGVEQPGELAWLGLDGSITVLSAHGLLHACPRKGNSGY